MYTFISKFSVVFPTVKKKTTKKLSKTVKFVADVQDVNSIDLIDLGLKLSIFLNIVFGASFLVFNYKNHRTPSNGDLKKS